MKHRILSIVMLCTVLLPVLLGGCGGSVRDDVPTWDVLEAALEAVGRRDYADLYSSLATEDADSYIDPDYAGQVMCGEYGAPLAEEGVIAEYALCIPEGLYAFEIDVMHVTDASHVEAVTQLLQTRYDLKAARKSEMIHYISQDPHAVAETKAIEDMEIFTLGNYVILLATDNNTAAHNAISALLGAKEVRTEAVTDGAKTVETALTTEAVTTAPPKDEEELAAADGLYMTIVSASAPDRMVLGGSCVVGAEIHITGTPEEHVFRTDDGSWLCEFEIFGEGETEITVTQVHEDKVSAPLHVSAEYDPSVDFSSHGIYAAVIGDGMQGHFVEQLDDWRGTNLLDASGKGKVKRSVREKVTFLNDYIDGAELVYVIVPNQMYVYPETAPAWEERSTAKETRKEQFKALAESEGATVIDLYDVMTAHKDDEFKLFHKTDSHWTDYGAYWGYHTLMTHVANKFPDAAPLEIEGNFRFYEKSVIAGDMMTHLEIENDLLSENCTFVEWLFEEENNPPLYMEGKNELDYTPIKDQQTRVNPNVGDRTLPSAMIIRDSFSTNIFGYLCNGFSEIHWRAMWDYSFKKADIKRAMPDYVIYLVAEKSLGNILW